MIVPQFVSALLALVLVYNPCIRMIGHRVVFAGSTCRERQGHDRYLQYSYFMVVIGTAPGQLFEDRETIDLRFNVSSKGVAADLTDIGKAQTGLRPGLRRPFFVDFGPVSLFAHSYDLERYFKFDQNVQYDIQADLPVDISGEGDGVINFRTRSRTVGQGKKSE